MARPRQIGSPELIEAVEARRREIDLAYSQAHKAHDRLIEALVKAHASGASVHVLSEACGYRRDEVALWVKLPGLVGTNWCEYWREHRLIGSTRTQAARRCAD
jgi:hypothetical protein